MSFTEPQILVLTAFSRLAQRDRAATRSSLAQESALGSHALEAALRSLARLGLVDLARLRLTLPGLCIAVSADAKIDTSSKRSAGMTRRSAQPRQPSRSRPKAASRLRHVRVHGSL